MNVKTKLQKAKRPEIINKARHIKLEHKDGVSDDRLIAQIALNPITANASTVLDYSSSLFTDLSLLDCIEVLKSDMKKVNEGDLDNLEAMLTCQASVLNAMFNNMAKLAIHADVMSKLDSYMRLALKAQSQCRTTVEAIAELKFPKSSTFIRQANIANQQQVNNGRQDIQTSTHVYGRTQEFLNLQNQLSGKCIEL